MARKSDSFCRSRVRAARQWLRGFPGCPTIMSYICDPGGARVSTSVRLDPEMERIVTRVARLSGRSKSQVIRDAIHQLRRQEIEGDSSPTAYARLADVIGIVDLGPGDRAARSESTLRALFAAKRRR